jgi:phosphopantothenoylcysteine decarboxylase/phosphopantothenate--cysteine ligase
VAEILLGVTGCIAAYKAAILLRELQKKGHSVQVLMTRHATEFVGAITFEALSGRRVWTEMFGHPTEGGIEHINVAREADLLLVAPATADAVAKFAQGLADDFLSTVHLSVTCPVIVAPAMNVEMWRHPAMQQNLATLKSRGVRIVDPDAGYLACGVVGEGRLAEVERIVETAEAVLGRSVRLAGKRILVTAGPTCEDIDPVRFLSNRSSGKMGYVLAEQASGRGASVTLVSGPTSLEPPPGVELIAVRTVAEMQREVQNRFPMADVLFMAAAVGDFTLNPSPKKLKKQDSLTLHLTRAEDILASLSKQPGQVVVGFAAESENLLENAAGKLSQKRLDLVVGNGVDAFGSDFNQALIVRADGSSRQLERMPKVAVADRLLDEIEALLRVRPDVFDSRPA